MKREKLICGLKEEREGCSEGDPFRGTIDKAIAALEQEPCEDAISRKSTIEMLNERFGTLIPTDDIIAAIECMPSVTPKQPEQVGTRMSLADVPDTNVGDMISRQAAIDGG